MSMDAGTFLSLAKVGNVVNSKETTVNALITLRPQLLIMVFLISPTHSTSSTEHSKFVVKVETFILFPGIRVIE